MKATKISEIGRFARPDPLTDGNWDAYFLTTDEARHASAALMLVEKLKQSYMSNQRLKALFTGHMGCGKSTELLRVKREVSDSYEVVIAHVGQRYSLRSLDYKELLLFCAQKFIETAEDVGAELPRDDGDRLLAWFDKVESHAELKSGNEMDVRAGGAIEASVGAGLPSAVKALSPFSFKTAVSASSRLEARIFNGGETRKRVTTQIGEHLDELVGLMKIVVDAIEARKAPLQLLLVLEDLDKIEAPQQARMLFGESRLQLLAIPASVIFTFPIQLYHEPGPWDRYDEREVLPMIPIRKPPPTDLGMGLPDEEREQKARAGQDALAKIVLRRIEANLFGASALETLIAKCGGVIRDLLQMIRDAAIEVKIEGGDRIELRHAEAIARKLRNEYSKRLSAPSQSDGQAITIGEIWETIGKHEDWPKRTLDMTPASRQLLQSLCILEYNGERWYDLHPLVRDYLLIRESEEKQRAARSAGGGKLDG